MKKILTLMVLLMAMMSAGTAYGQKPEKAANESEQCTATTKKGTRCKLKVVDGKKFCPNHIAKDATVSQCKATTKKGTRCTRAAVKGKNGYCTQHYNKSTESLGTGPLTHEQGKI